MRPHRSIAVLQGLLFAAYGCRPAVPRVEPVVRDYMAMCPPDARQGVACAQPMATCTARFSQCGPTPSVAPGEQPVAPRCSAHETRCECVAVAGAGAPAWSCRTELAHPAGPQPPPELPSLA